MKQSLKVNLHTQGKLFFDKGIIESGCDNCEGGEYPADEDVTLPPYHPYCNCQWYWDYTDSEDDINDLDLEIEE